MRINILVSDELNGKLDAIAKRYGISKSNLCGFILGQYIDNTEKMQNAVYGNTDQSGLIVKALDKAISEVIKEK